MTHSTTHGTQLHWPRAAALLASTAVLLAAAAAPALAREAAQSPDDCVELRRYLYQQTELLKAKQAEYDEWQNTFNKFYDDSQIAMEVVYEETAWKFETPVPFVGDMEIAKPVSVTGGVEYVPQVRLTGATSRRKSVLDLVDNLEKLASLVGAPDEVGKVLSGFKSGFTTLTDVLTEYDTALTTHREYTESRQKMLGNYSQILTTFYCDNILPIEEEILRIRDQGIAASDCTPQEAQVLVTDVTRSTRLRNPEHLGRAQSWCQLQAPEGLTDEAKRAAAMFAGISCMMADPNYWEAFFEEMFDGSDEEAKRAAQEADEAKMLRFWRTYGFKDDRDAMGTAAKYAKNPEWEDLVVQNVQRQCGAVLNDESTIRQVVQAFAAEQ